MMRRAFRQHFASSVFRAPRRSQNAVKATLTMALLLLVAGCAQQTAVAPTAVAPLLDREKEVAVQAPTASFSPLTVYGTDRSYPSPVVGTREITVHKNKAAANLRSPHEVLQGHPLVGAIETAAVPGLAQAETAVAAGALIVILPVALTAMLVQEVTRDDQRKKRDADRAALVQQSINVARLNETFVAGFKAALGWKGSVTFLSTTEGIDLQISKIYLAPYEPKSQRLVVCGQALFYYYGNRPYREFETCTEEILYSDDQFAKEGDIDRFRARVLRATEKLAESMAQELARAPQ